MRAMVPSLRCGTNAPARAASRRCVAFAAAAPLTPIGGVVPRAPTTPTPRLSPEKVIERMNEVLPTSVRDQERAFYSSELGGIVTDPALMVLHHTEAAVGGGYVVEEVARLYGGYVHALPRAVDRLLAAAEAAALLAPGVSHADVMRIVLDTAAASKLLDGYIRVWVAAGRSWQTPALYVAVSSEGPTVDRTKGLRVVTSPVPPSPVPHLRLAGSVHYELCRLEAQQRGADTGVFVDDEGFLLDSPGASIALITRNNVLVTPPSDVVLPTSSMELLLDLAPKADDAAGVEVVASEQRPIHVSEVQECREVFLTSTLLGVVAVVGWDGVLLGGEGEEGEPGTNSLALHELLGVAYREVGSPLHIEVPYGYLTGMREQLR